MSGPRFLLEGRYVVVPDFVAAELAAVVAEAMAERRRRDGWSFSPAALDVLASLEAAAAPVLAEQVSLRVSGLDPDGFRGATVSTEVVSRGLGVSEVAVRRRCRAGTIPARRGRGGRWEIDARWWQEHGVPDGRD